jgi:hypothetical protein
MDLKPAFHLKRKSCSGASLLRRSLCSFGTTRVYTGVEVNLTVTCDEYATER